MKTLQDALPLPRKATKKMLDQLGQIFPITPECAADLALAIKFEKFTRNGRRSNRQAGVRECG